MGRSTTKGLFVGERVTEAREARGLTQAALAERLGRSGPSVSKWERGEQAPEPGMLDGLARELGVYPGYFMQTMPQHGTSAIFFRSLSNAATKARTRERARVRWLQHISLVLQRTLDFPPVDMPQLAKPGEYLTMREADLERIATELRAHWGLGDGPIPSMVLVAENAGIVVGAADTGSMAIDGQGTWSQVDGRPYILLARDKDTAFRRQVDVAHEIAHLTIHRGVTAEILARDFELIEEQAKYLAGAILLPHRAFAGEVFSLSLDGFLAMKPRWCVSVGAMVMRAHHLGMLSAEAAQRLWKYRASRGWHRREPLDHSSETPVEEPRLLRRSVEMLVDARVRRSRDLLEADICLGAEDVETIAALRPGYFSEGSAEVVALAPRLRETKGAEVGSAVVPFRRSR